MTRLAISITEYVGHTFCDAECEKLASTGVQIEIERR